jgi:SpoVK/Ycf46/Vps4 family AAA+-type ATPase
VDSASVFSPFFGDAEKFIRDQFKLARQMTPCILFFDEIDAGKHVASSLLSLSLALTRTYTHTLSPLFFFLCSSSSPNSYINSVVGKRSSEMGAGGGTGVAERVLSTLLNEMDGIQPSLGVLVIVYFPLVSLHLMSCCFLTLIPSYLNNRLLRIDSICWIQHF